MRGLTVLRVVRSLRRPALVLVLLLAVFGVGALAHVHKPRHGDSRIVSATRFLSPTGVDRGGCRRKKRPCLTFNYAYQEAMRGEIVEVAAGDYADQTITSNAVKTGSGRVIFRPAEKAKVSLGKIRVEASNVELRNMRTPEWYAAPGSRNLVFRNIRVKGAIFITSASRISVIGGSVGPGTNFSPEIKAAAGSTVAPRNILIDGVTFHDWTRTDLSAHVDCLHVLTVDGLVVRNSRFRNCEAFNILFTQYGDAGPPRHVVIENNFFDCCRSGFYSVYLSGQPALNGGSPFRDFLIRFNSANKGFAVGETTTDAASDVRFDSNVAPIPNRLLCAWTGVSWSYNVWQGKGSRCSKSDRVARPGFLDPVNLDFRLRRGAAPVDRGNPTDFPARDIEGNRRPSGRAPDAGAYEFQKK
ncbi:MAG: hypothetical protein QOF64_2440 [Candidatus Binatota bacterium]|nr:hypothetical protein [Candidatus Binatota bacterium]